MKKTYIKPEITIVKAETSAILADSATLQRGYRQQNDAWPDNPDEKNRLWVE